MRTSFLSEGLAIEAQMNWGASSLRDRDGGPSVFDGLQSPENHPDRHRRSKMFVPHSAGRDRASLFTISQTECHSGMAGTVYVLAEIAAGTQERGTPMAECGLRQREQCAVLRAGGTADQDECAQVRYPAQG